MTDQTIPPADNNSGDRVLSQWNQLGVHKYIKIGIIVILFYWLYYREINQIVGQWINNPSWSHGFIIPLFSIYFLNQEKKNILNLESKPNYLGLLFVICGIIFYPLNMVQIRFGYLSPLSMIATLGAVALFLGGWKLVRYTWLPIGFLFFAIPLPDRYYRMITIPLRIRASSVAGDVLNLVSGLEAKVRGVIIDIDYKGQEHVLNVAEACSGMRLLMAFMALGVAMAYLHKRPFWQRLVLLASTIPIAILCNIIRVTVTGFISVFIGRQYIEGIYHDMLGMLMLPLAFIFYGVLAWFMSNLFIEESKLQPAKEDIIVRKSVKKDSE